MKRIVRANDLTSTHKSLDELQSRIESLQEIKDKLGAKLNSENQQKIEESVSFFVNAIDDCIGTYAKTIYDSTL